jgi:tol-pal system protein YbgF
MAGILAGAARAVILAVLLTLPGLPAAAQQGGAQTLADIRAEIARLAEDIARLREELVGSGAVAQPGGGTLLDRVQSAEVELTRLTGLAEELELRINRIVEDATLRIGDLEFRLTELEGGDVSALGQTRPLGETDVGAAAPGAADAGTSAGGAPATETTAATIGATAETGTAATAPTPEVPAADSALAPAATPTPAPNILRRAEEVLGQGDFRGAEQILAAHAAANPADPLIGEVHYLRGEALDALGDKAGAAQAYFESFSGSPAGARAPDAMLRLGLAMAELGQWVDACILLSEVGLRFPGTPAVAGADAARLSLKCP